MQKFIAANEELLPSKYSIVVIQHLVYSIGFRMFSFSCHLVSEALQLFNIRTFD